MLTFLAGRVRTSALTTTSRSRFGVSRHSSSASTQKAQAEEEFDWMKIGQKHVSELPEAEEVDEQSIKQGMDWWKSVVFDDVFADEKDISDALDKMQGEKEVSLAAVLLNVPLPDQAYPADMHPVAVQQRLHRYEELLKACIKTSTADTMVDSFVSIRREGFIPPANWYHTLIAKLLNDGDLEGIQYLVREMKELNYSHSLVSYSALIILSMLKRDTKGLEELWAQMLGEKYEPSTALHLHRLLYYCRYTDDFDKSVSVYDEIVAAGEKDTQAANIVLATCRNNNVLDWAQKTYSGLKARGLLDVEPGKDHFKYTVDGTNFEFPLKAEGALLTEVLMAEVYCRQGMEREAEEGLARVKKIYDRCIKKVPTDEWEQPLSVYESFFDMYAKNKNIKKADATIEEIFGKNHRPSNDLLIKFFEFGAAAKYPKVYHIVMVNFDMLGYKWTPELVAAAMKMFYAVGDYRRFRNLWDLCLEIGARPTTECRTMMLDVYAKTGYPDDAQYFYETQIRNGVPVDRRFHEVMMKNFIDRGFPGSALEISKELSKAGRPLTQEELEGIIVAYSKLGGADQIAGVLEKMAKDSKYTITASSVILALEAYAKKGISAFPTLHRLWTKYSSMFTLDPETAYKLIEIFQEFNKYDIVYSIFERAKVDHSYGPDDGARLWELMLNIPAFPTLSLPQRLQHIEEASESGIEPTPKMYRGAILLCYDYRDMATALSLIKKYISANTQFNIPLNVGVVVDFLTVLHKMEFSTVGRAARTWLQRLVPLQEIPFIMKTPSSFTLRKHIDEGDDFHDYLKTYLPITTSMQVAQFISRLEVENLTFGREQENSFKELFTGSDVDVEDLLLHKYGKERPAVYQALHDPEYEQVQSKLDEVERERAELRNQEDWKDFKSENTLRDTWIAREAVREFAETTERTTKDFYTWANLSVENEPYEGFTVDEGAPELLKFHGVPKPLVEEEELEDADYEDPEAKSAREKEAQEFINFLKKKAE